MQHHTARFASAAALVVAAVGAAVFCGWVFDITVLKAIYGPITMKTNTAVAFVCCGTSLWLRVHGRAPYLATTTAGVAALIGGATLLQHLSGYDFRIDQLLFSEAPGAAATASPNRMGPHGSTSFLMAGLALILRRRDSVPIARLAQAVAFAGAAFAMVPITGYVYGAVELYGMAQYTGIALHTAITLFLLHVGILAANAQAGAVATFVDEGVAGTLLRRLVVPVVALPLILGFLFVQGRNAELFDRGLGISLFAVATIVVLLAILWRTAATIQASDRERRAAYEAAESASRLKDQFIAALSHELRTPLNVMLGRLRLLEGETDPETRLRGARVIARNGQLLARLVEDLLDLSRATAGQFEIAPAPIDLNSLVRLTIDSVAGEALRQQLQIATDFSPAAGIVNADAQRMQQVLVNLLSNSLKFTPAGGVITVRTGRAGASVRITVADTGIGFDQGFAPHLFEPFRQADQSASRQHGGLGLGLSIAEHLIALHGGTIAAASPGAGRGATFTITLPAVPVSNPVEDHRAAVASGLEASLL